MLELKYVDRRTGEYCTEVIFMEAGLRLLYENPLGIWVFNRWLNQAWICWLCAQWYSLSWSRRQIVPFMQKHHIDAAEFATSIADFPHFNAFFARQLHPESRPFIARKHTLMSPSDGKILVYPDLADLAALPIKGIGMSLASLLASQALADRYQSGAAAIIRLAPADYHRFHFPTDGMVDRSQLLPGRYHSVHPIALHQVPDAFCQNQRTITSIHSEQFGTFLMIEVGAFCIGTIIQTHSPGAIVAGQEKGFFQFGGSTIVLLFQPDRIQFDADLVRYSVMGLETQIQAGEAIGQAIGSISQSVGKESFDF